MEREIIILKAYAQALQKQNQAKNREQVVLYQQFQNMKKQLIDLEKYYYRSRQLSKEINGLKDQLKQKNQDYIHAVNSLNKNQDICLKNIKLQQELRQNSKIIFELKQKLNQALSHEKQLYRQIQINQHQLTQEQMKNLQLINVINEKQMHIEALAEHIQKLQKQQNESSQSNLNPHSRRNFEFLQQKLSTKQKRIRQMEQYIMELQISCEEFNNQLSRMQSKEKKLQSYIKRLNKRIEQTAQNQNNLIFKKQSSFSNYDIPSQKSSERMNNSQKQNSNIASNIANSQRLVVSEYAHNNMKNSQNKLKLRVDALKKENQKLLKQIS